MQRVRGLDRTPPILNCHCLCGPTWQNIPNEPPPPSPPALSVAELELQSCASARPEKRGPSLVPVLCIPPPQPSHEGQRHHKITSLLVLRLPSSMINKENTGHHSAYSTRRAWFTTQCRGYATTSLTSAPPGPFGPPCTPLVRRRLTRSPKSTSAILIPTSSIPAPRICLKSNRHNIAKDIGVEKGGAGSTEDDDGRSIW